MKRGRIGSIGRRSRLLAQALLAQHVSQDLSLLGQQVSQDLSLLALVRHYSLPPMLPFLSLGVGLVALAARWPHVALLTPEATREKCLLYSHVPVLALRKASSCTYTSL